MTDKTTWGPMDLRYSGHTLVAQIHLAFPLCTAREELLRAGAEAALALEQMAKGPLRHMALVAATSGRERGIVRVRITAMVNTPETMEEFQPRLDAFVAEGRWAVIYCAIQENDGDEAEESWTRMISVAAKVSAKGEPS